MPPASEPRRGGLLSIFEADPEPNPNITPAQAQAGDSGAGFSTSNYDPEAARLLDAVPDVIGVDGKGHAAGEADDLGGPADVPGTGLDVFGQIVKPEMLQPVLTAAFGWVAEWRKRECYRLDADKAGTLAGVWTPVLNQWWTRFAPSFLAQWSMQNPGLFAAILTTAVTVGPMVSADLAETAKEKAKRSFVREGTSHAMPPAQPKPATPRGGGMIWEESQEAA